MINIEDIRNEIYEYREENPVLDKRFDICFNDYYYDPIAEREVIEDFYELFTAKYNKQDFHDLLVEYKFKHLGN